MKKPAAPVTQAILLNPLSVVLATATPLKGFLSDQSFWRVSDLSCFHQGITWQFRLHSDQFAGTCTLFHLLLPKKPAVCQKATKKTIFIIILSIILLLKSICQRRVLSDLMPSANYCSFLTPIPKAYSKGWNQS